MKLNQLLAILPTKKAETAKELTAAHHQKAELFQGISRTYRPKDDEGEQLPSESKIVQVRVGDAIRRVKSAVGNLWDCVAMQDIANTQAKADVTVDGVTLFKDVPVTHLLFLEKQLKDLETFVIGLQILDPVEEWSLDDKTDCYVTKPTETTRTKKLPRAFIKYDATPEHPAQVEMFTEDVVIGYWRQIKFSGAMPAAEKAGMLSRVRQVREAVIKAREAANLQDVPQTTHAAALLDYIFPKATQS